MAKSVTITLTSAGADTGPFNLLSNADSYVTPFETNIPKASLVGGYTSNLVPDAATIIRVQSSSSLCTNYVDAAYPSGSTTTTTTTTTSTTSTTTTVASTNHFRSVTPQTSAANACSQTTPSNIYTSTATSTMAVSIVFYSDSGLTTVFNGNSQWYKILWKGAVGTDDIYAVQINSSGVVLAWEYCPTTTTTTTSTTTTTTTLGYNSFLLAYSATDGAEACSRYPTLFTNTYYTNPAISVLSNGVTIYQDTSLTSPAGNGFYSNGTNYWNTGGGAGTLSNQTSCGGTTSTTTTTTTSAATTASIYIDNNNSLDIPITDMTINGVSVTYEAGSNFTINAGNNGNFSTDQTGIYTVVIYYGAHIPGQNLVFIDSDSNITCKDLNGSAGSFTIPASTITAGTTIYVTGADGACS